MTSTRERRNRFVAAPPAVDAVTAAAAVAVAAVDTNDVIFPRRLTRTR